MYVELISKEDYLSHHGVKGQSWGDRNGPPYPLSRLGSEIGQEIRRKRKAKLQKENEKIRKRNAELRKRNKEIEENRRLKERKKELREETKKLKRNKPEKEKKIKESKETKPKEEKKVIKTKNLSRKDIRKMSDEELRVYIDRLRLEKELWKLDNETVVSGKKVVGDILKKAGKESAENIAKSVFTGAGKYAVKKLIGAAVNEEVANEIMSSGQQQKQPKNQSNQQQKQPKPQNVQQPNRPKSQNTQQIVNEVTNQVQSNSNIEKQIEKMTNQAMTEATKFAVNEVVKQTVQDDLKWLEEQRKKNS